MLYYRLYTKCFLELDTTNYRVDWTKQQLCMLPIIFSKGKYLAAVLGEGSADVAMFLL